MDSKPTSEVVIPLSKAKVVFLLLGSVAFVVVSVWIWRVADSQIRYNPVFMKAVAMVTASFFGLCAIYGCIKVFDTKPGLIIDHKGIVDNSSAVSAGRIYWDEIKGLKVSKMFGQRFLTIEVFDPEKYVGGASFFRRNLNAASMKLSGSPINISSNTLRVKFDVLAQVLTKALEKHKGAGRTNGSRRA